MERQGHVAALDGLRAVAAMLVFARHVFGLSGGVLGVSVFFVLSGYLITGILLGRPALGTFYLRRVRRLVPALVLAVLLAVALRPYTFAWALSEVTAALTYTADFFDASGPLAVTWSLAVEEQFYLIWPVLLLGAVSMWGARGAARTCVGLLVASAVAPALLYALTGGVVADHVSGAPLLLFAGCLLALATRNGLPEVFHSPTVPALAAAMLGFAILATHEDGDPWLLYGGYILVAAASCALIGSLAASDAGPVSRVLASRPLRWLGERSYGFYLFHLIVFRLFQQTLPHAPVIVCGVLTLTGTLVISALSYALVERPVRSWSRPRLLRVAWASTP